MERDTLMFLGILGGMCVFLGGAIAWVVLDKKGYFLRKQKLFDSIRSASEETIQSSIFTPLHKFKDCTGFSSKRGRAIWAEAVRLANDTMDQIYIPKIENIKNIKVLQKFFADVYDIHEIYLKSIYSVKTRFVTVVEPFPTWMEVVKEKLEKLVIDCNDPKILSACVHVFPEDSDKRRNMYAACDRLVYQIATDFLREKNLNVVGYCENAKMAKSEFLIEFLNMAFVNAMQKEISLLKMKEIPFFLEEVIRRILAFACVEPAVKEIRAIREDIIVYLYEATSESKFEVLVDCVRGFTSGKAVLSFLDKVEAVIPGMKIRLFNEVYL